MTRQRLQVDSGLSPERLRPVASPVDTFTQPAAGQQLAQLAAGLSSLAPALKQFSTVLSERDRVKQDREGEVQAQQDMALGAEKARDAVKQRLIQPHQNPHFIASYRRTLGEATAGQYETKLFEFMATDDKLRNSTNTDDFATRVNEFRKTWLDGQVPEDQRDAFFMQSFNRYADAYQENMARKWASDVGARIEKDAGEALGANLYQRLRDHYGDTSVPIVDVLREKVQEYLAGNPNGGRFANEKLVNAVSDYAIERGDEHVLDILDSFETAPGAKLGNAEWVRDLKDKTQQRIVMNRRSAIDLANQQEARDRVVRERGFMSDFREALTQDPMSVRGNLKIWRDRYRTDVDPAGDPTVVDEMLQRFDQAESERPLDRRAFNDAVLKTLDGSLSMGHVRNLFASGKITNQQAIQLWQMSEQLAQRGGMGDALHDEHFRIHLGVLGKQLGQSMFEADQQAARDREAAATSFYIRAAMNDLSWMKMSDPDRDAFFQRLREQAAALAEQLKNPTPPPPSISPAVVTDTARPPGHKPRGQDGVAESQLPITKESLPAIEAQVTAFVRTRGQAQLHPAIVRQMVKDGVKPGDPASMQQWLTKKRDELQQQP